MSARRLLGRHYDAFRQQFEAAMAHFENHPGFADVQVRIHDGSRDIDRNASVSAQMHNPIDPFFRVAAKFDLRAEAYVGLVDEMADQKEYLTLLEGFRLAAMEEYSGFSGAEIQFAGESPQEQVLADRVSHWTTLGYKRLEAKRQLKPEKTTVCGPMADQRAAREPRQVAPAASEAEKGTLAEPGVPEQPQRTPALRDPAGQIPPKVAGAETVVRAAAKPIESTETTATKKPRQHGFLPDMTRHAIIAAIVERHVPDWRTSKRHREADKLKLICSDLDQEASDLMPESWKTEGKTPDALGDTCVQKWTEALEMAKSGKKLVVDQIETSLDAIRKADAKTP